MFDHVQEHCVVGPWEARTPMGVIVWSMLLLSMLLQTANVCILPIADVWQGGSMGYGLHGAVTRSWSHVRSVWLWSTEIAFTCWHQIWWFTATTNALDSIVSSGQPGWRVVPHALNSRLVALGITLVGLTSFSLGLEGLLWMVDAWWPCWP